MFAPVNVGNTGRRAIAWFVRSGVVCSATDASVAAHAMAVVLEALARVERPGDAAYLSRMAEAVVVRFPEQPGAYHEQSEGEIDVDVHRNGIGYGYLRQASEGYECGGALFDAASRTAQVIGPYPVLLFDAERDEG